MIDCVSNLRPWRVRLPRRGTAGVLELPAGTLAASQHEHGPPDRARAVGPGRNAMTAGHDARRAARRDDGDRRADAAGAAGDHRRDRPAPRHAGAADAEDADRRREQRHPARREPAPALLGARRDGAARAGREADRGARHERRRHRRLSLRAHRPRARTRDAVPRHQSLRRSRAGAAGAVQRLRARLRWRRGRGSTAIAWRTGFEHLVVSHGDVSTSSARR